jgi:hypothetical protein
MKDELLRSNNEGNNVGSGVESVLEGFEKIYKRDPEKDGEIKIFKYLELRKTARGGSEE